LKDCKKEEMQSQKQKLSGNVEVGKTDCGKKEAAIFSIHVEPAEKSGRPSYRNAGQVWDLGRSPVNLPVDASSFNEEIEPLVARRTILLLKKVRCGLNLE
jgi:hypothetical protein